jgi:mRNA-degrading endonuclease RelE of RelBE toxin-antitoxin system
MYQIKTTPTFDKDIKRLDRQIAKLYNFMI